MMREILRKLGRPFHRRGSLTCLTLAVFYLATIGIAPGEAAALKKKDKGYKEQTEQAEKQGYIGVTMQSLTDDIIKGLDLKTKRGVLISEVIEDSPAEEAGLQDGDIIVAYDGKTVTSPEGLSKLVKATPVGKEVDMKIVRDDDAKTVTVTVGEKPEESTWTHMDDNKLRDYFLRVAEPGAQLGVKIQDLDDEDFASYFGVKEGEGVLVMGVEKESAAEEAGVKAGDVILSLNDEEIGSTAELIKKVRKMEEGDKFELVVKRHGQTKTLSGEMKEGEGLLSYCFPGDMPRFLKGKDLRLHLDQGKLDELRPELNRRFLIEKDDLKAEMKELKKELRKLKERLDKLEE
jgi:C-terminal processing protease CtpA/Prc